MILNRVHQPLHSVTLAELCREAGWVCPIQTDWPLRVELTPSEGAVGPHWRNHPGGSYSTGLSDAAAIIEMLAYEAHEWQAWEVARERRRGGSYRFALLT